MDRLAQWETGNEKYLSLALSWLRLRLEQAADQHSQQAPQPSVLPAAKHSLLTWRTAPKNSRVPIALMPPAAVTEQQVSLAAKAMVESETTVEPGPAIALLAQRFGLSRYEREILLLCAAAEMDTRVPALCSAASGDPNRAYPSFALAMAILGEPAWDALSPDRPLRYWRMIEINQPAGQPLTSSPIRADERVVNYIKGLNHLDDRLMPLISAIETSVGSDLSGTQQSAAAKILQLLKALAKTQMPFVQLVGTDSISKRLIATYVAAELGLRLYRLPAGLLPAQPAELETLARLWQRESVLLPVALYLEASDLEVGALTDPQSNVFRFLSRSHCLIFLDVREMLLHPERRSIIGDAAKPNPTEQYQMWCSCLTPIGAEQATRLAGQFNLNLSEIREIAESAKAEAVEDAASGESGIWENCLLRTRPRLDALAQRIEPRADWSDIVLPAPEQALLCEIAAQVANRSKVYDEWGFRQKMNRGLGISALFAGESGTGKTMAAEVLAKNLNLNLYRIDLSAVVSKYIGETEKNLRRLFDAAEDGGAILFFDEADALFGKRSEVKDSHDRYANIEINYLLQRMEGYRGLAILASNMKNALDTAFLRRLRFIVTFPFPGLAERKSIWQKAFPKEMQLAHLDFDRLAELNLTGGSVHCVAVNAAFLAAHQGTTVTMSLVLSAARTEFRKLERPINESEFKWERADEVA
jgi:hypothetical protein